MCQHRRHAATTPAAGSDLALAVVTVAPSVIATPELGGAIAEATGLSDAPSAATVRIDAGAELGGYATPAVEPAKGGTLSVINFDGTRHSGLRGGTISRREQRSVHLTG